MKNYKDILPDVQIQEDLQTLDVKQNDYRLPETTFENVSTDELENYYRRSLSNGSLYFVGYDLPGSSEEEQVTVDNKERHTIFVTGNVVDQLTTIAIKFNGKLYQLNDDFYIVRSPDQTMFQTSAVFVSSLVPEQIQNLMSLYNIQGQTIGLQTVARGALLDLVQFEKSLKTLSDNKSVYLIDLAFIDFTIEESANFQAYLVTNPVDILKVRSFSDVFSMYLDCDIDDLRSRNFYSQSLLSSDGNESKFDVGTTHSREQRSISDQGTSTVSSYSDISDGFQLTFKPETTVNNTVICNVILESSTFTDEQYNTKRETSLDVQQIPFQLGKTYYLSSLTNVLKRRTISLFGIEFGNDHRIQTCWARVRKIK